MEKPDIKIDYEKDEDMLHFSRGESKVKFSFDIELDGGDVVIDFDSQGYIIGLEFFNASNYFPFLKTIGNKKLKAKMSVQYSSNWARINYQIMVPGRKPIVNEILSPYNKKLILEH